jgi:hypothetical protein
MSTRRAIAWTPMLAIRRKLLLSLNPHIRMIIAVSPRDVLKASCTDASTCRPVDTSDVMRDLHLSWRRIRRHLSCAVEVSAVVQPGRQEHRTRQAPKPQHDHPCPQEHRPCPGHIEKQAPHHGRFALTPVQHCLHPLERTRPVRLFPDTPLVIGWTQRVISSVTIPLVHF